jgi:gliding motility-associated-like protein
VDGFSNFDLNQLRSEIELLVPTGSTITFFSSENDLQAETNPIDGNYTNTEQNSETIYVLISNGSNCFATSTVILSVIFTPELRDDETIKYCENTYPETIILEAGILTGQPDDFTYEWLLNGSLTAFNTESININETGIYTVIITHPNRCTGTRNITVELSDIAIIDTVSVVGITPNNSVTISVSGNSNYEYALDNGPYQDSNEFTNIPAGEHLVSIRDKYGCGITEDIFSVLGFPTYFTPNGDNFHDTWKPIGVDVRYRSTMIIHIYNRFGKLIKQVNPNGNGWNGTLNGENLPVDDYWYVVTFSNGKEYRGHFTLKR